MNKVKTVIESAESRLSDAERQYGLGFDDARVDMAYWAAFLDGAHAQKKEDMNDKRICN